MSHLIRRLVGTILMLMLVCWVLLQLLPPALPFLGAIWLLSVFGAGIFAKRKW